ncbi:FMN-binding negative transcriptional regulator [Kroppenstedtia eburnea]|uniref:FMN-binding negative transcriptional regulator n=1 Tax=Kroppenstedtia eburnea TaxID=714067 RepID=UPI003631DFE7
MYIPKKYKVTDVNELLDFVETNAFATIVTMKDNKPIATHLPLRLSKKEDTYYLTGHFAYGNPQWRTLAENDQVLVMFQGPHAYISSSWYSHEDVPTWDYQAVHIYGKASVLEKEELVKDLTGMLEKYEAHREHPVLWDTLSPSLLERELKGIVGFQVKIEDIQASYKSSQNKNDTDFHNIIENLHKEGNPNASAIAEQMKKLRK